MKKYLSVLFLIVFIVPSVVFASWWNPLNWNIFSFLHKKEVIPQVQVEVQKTPEEKIGELQKQLDELKNEQSDFTTSSETTPLAKEVKKTTPVVNNIVKVMQPTPVSDVCSNIEGIQSKIPDGYYSSSLDICTLIVVKDYCPNIEGTQSKIPDGKLFYKNTGECLTLDEIEAKENEVILLKKSQITTISAGEMKCSPESSGFYFLPFDIDGEWVSGWVQVKIIYDKSGSIATRGMDLDISNIRDGYTFSPKGNHLGNFNIDLKAGYSGSYKISIHSVVPKYTSTGGHVFPTYSASSLIAEESGEFTLPNCSK